MYCLIEWYQWNMLVKNSFRIFSIPSKCSKARRVNVVKPDDKNVYSGTAIKERVSQSKLPITQYP